MPSRTPSKHAKSSQSDVLLSYLCKRLFGGSSCGVACSVGGQARACHAIHLQRTGVAHHTKPVPLPSGASTTPTGFALPCVTLLFLVTSIPSPDIQSRHRMMPVNCHTVARKFQATIARQKLHYGPWMVMRSKSTLEMPVSLLLRYRGTCNH